MTRARYTGHETLTFNDYLDLDTGRTLTAVPGGVYDMSPTGGRLVDDVPLAWFTPLDPPAAPADEGGSGDEAVPAEEAADEPPAEPDGQEQQPEEQQD